MTDAPTARSTRGWAETVARVRAFVAARVSDPELAADIASFRAEELEHRDTARDHGAAETIGYPLLTAAIRAGCRLAIGLSKRI